MLEHDYANVACAATESLPVITSGESGVNLSCFREGKPVDAGDIGLL